VESGQIELRTTVPTRWFSHIDRIVQTDTDVVFVRARLLPPGLNTAFSVRGQDAYGWARPYFVSAARQRDVLEQAGFQLHEAQSWFAKSQPRTDPLVRRPVTRGEKARRVLQAALSGLAVGVAAIWAREPALAAPAALGVFAISLAWSTVSRRYP